MDTWFQFAAVAAIICFTGAKLSYHGDVIADRTGLGRNWIGLVLLAAVTSLPELFTSISAVTFNDLPDMAVSGNIGSCMFNMLIIALLDLLSRHKPVSLLVHEGHILSAGFGIVLMGFATIDILFEKHLPDTTVLGFIDPMSILFIIIYLLAMKLIYAYDKARIKEFVQEVAQDAENKHALKNSLCWFLLYSAIIVAAACYLPELGERIAKLTGWGESFIGNSFIAISTSLPEIAVSVAAARMGAFDMAVANLFGSNIFNIAVIAVTDLFYKKGALLRTVSDINTISGISAMICMGIVVIGLTYRSEKKWFYLAGDAVAIALVYIFANVLLFALQ